MVASSNTTVTDPFDAAYDVASPILDELSFGYDQPLPAAQSLVVGIPSGTINVFYPQHQALEAAELRDTVLPSCPHPELRDAVALNREGISSNNPFHSFFALWRAYENALEVRVRGVVSTGVKQGFGTSPSLSGSYTESFMASTSIRFSNG